MSARLKRFIQQNKRFRKPRKRLFLFLLVSFFCNSCFVVRYFYWNFADINDYKKFDNLPVKKAETPFIFSYKNDTSFIKKIEYISYNNKKEYLESFLKKNKTVAFIIIKNDTILYEKYFYGYTKSSIIPSFSIAKSFTSALLGIAIGEGYIKNTNQPITDFIPELKDTNFKKVTLEHLLNMRSGINYNEGYFNPFGNVAKAYYGRNLMKHVTKIKTKIPPDQKFEYISINTQLLGIAIERATGKKLNQYLEEKIWDPLGMEFDASWSIDSKKNKTIKAFCCLNATAIDFAKFGRLYLNKGNWDGQQIIPEDYVLKSTIITKENKDFFYSYQWWHNVEYKKITNEKTINIDTTNIYQIYTKKTKGKEEKYLITPANDFMASGILGQYIYVFPEKKLIIVRFGKKKKKIAWHKFFREVAKKI